MKDAFGKRIQSLFALSSSSRAPRSERKRRLTFETLERRELLDAAPNLAIFDQTARLQLDNLDSVALTSYLADSTGSPVAPHYGETVYRRIALQNTGDAPLAINSVVASEGSRLEILNQIPESLAPNDETTILLRCRALLPETASLTIQTNDPDLPTQVVYLVGAVQTNSLQLPEITSLSLLRDTGDSASDKITCDPAVVGTLQGDLYGGRVSVEFDLDGDFIPDASEPVYVAGTFAFDPSDYSENSLRMGRFKRASGASVVFAQVTRQGAFGNSLSPSVLE